MSRSKKQYRAPWVLEIGEPKGDNAESIHARQLWRESKTTQAREIELDAMMRKTWNDPAYWAKHGFNPPTDPYPGIAEIRRQTGV